MYSVKIIKDKVNLAVEEKIVKFASVIASKCILPSISHKCVALPSLANISLSHLSQTHPPAIFYQ